MKVCRIWLIVLLCAFAVKAQTESVRVKLEAIYDGDTITVSDASKRDFKIRLIGIDAPELAQKFGDKARKKLAKLLKADKNNIVVKAFGVDRDKRILGQVFVGETDVNLELLKLGCAWFYDSRGFGRENLKFYKAVFESARSERLGLFAKKNAQDPKEFRKKN